MEDSDGSGWNVFGIFVLIFGLIGAGVIGNTYKIDYEFTSAKFNWPLCLIVGLQAVMGSLPFFAFGQIIGTTHRASLRIERTLEEDRVPASPVPETWGAPTDQPIDAPTPTVTAG
jgi:uncharacterized integral membrane protein